MLDLLLEFLNRSPSDPVRLPLLGSHRPVLMILATYLVFIKVLGPKIMQNRKPFDLRGVIKAYNIMQILYNIVMFIFAVHFMLGPGDYNFKCIKNLPPEHDYKTWERWLTYSYFFNKLLDLLETVFFVLRKKDRQISFLHVFHHMYMLYFSFMYLYYYGYGGHGFFMCFFNVIVHIMMYAYYYQSSLNRDSGVDLWWKKYITIVQLVQFGIILGHSIYTLRQPDCPSSRFSATCAGSICVVFIILFGNFYYQAYVRPKKTEQKVL
ncbi:elongation of very long chain fatty acids protein F-like [Drosophila gunungcola]|uniref:elongation of very long chain fatty acids protein F-like n=1 Tax=Drosophila gunungcola TaxID=103775 RepID=UPI0022E7ADC2|nr:elongation of very long chain fatty acids protein F-like [Drosophila gunungcola]